MAYVKRNQEHNGIEIYFDRKPSELILSSIKSEGWRWNGYKRCWYNYYSERHYAFANSICNEINGSTVKKKEIIKKEEKIEKTDKFAKNERNVKKLEQEAENVLLYSPKSNFEETDDPDTYVARKYRIHIKDEVTFILPNGYQAFGRVKEIISISEVEVDYSYFINGKKESESGLFPVESLTKDIGFERYKYDNLSRNKREEIDFNENVKNRIKGRLDSFSETYTTQINNVLFKHQKAGCLLAERYDRFAFFYDTGTGKTVMALDIINSKYQEDGTRFLIIAPKAIIQTAWMDDARDFYPDVRILPLITSFKFKKRKKLLEQWKGIQNEKKDDNQTERRDNYLELLWFLTDYEKPIETETSEDEDDRTIEDMVQHYIINPELFIRNPQKIIKEYNIQGIVVDESAIMKNYNSRTTQEIINVCENMKYVYLLSGKPAPNNELEYFSQMKVVDPDTFNMSYSRFANAFGVGDYQKEIWLSDSAKETLSKLISARSLIISKDDCLDLPPTVEVVHQFELPSDIMNEYDRLYEDCLAVIKGMDNSQRVYTSPSKLAVLMKLRQMASGFFIINDKNGGKEEKEIIPIHENKIEELNNIIEEIGDEQVIIWCQFQYEIKRIEESLSRKGVVVTAYGGTKDVNKSIVEFKEGRAKYIIAHPKTLKYGVTFTNCRYAIYYSFSYSAEDYDQSHDRIYRLGQKNKCTFFFLQAENTIDELMYQKVMKKLSNAEFFEWLIKDASNHGIDYEKLKERDDDNLTEISDELINEIVDANEVKRNEEEKEEYLDSETIAEKEIEALIELPNVEYNDLDKLHHIIDGMMENLSYYDNNIRALKYRFNLDSNAHKLRPWDEVGRWTGWVTGTTAKNYALYAKNKMINHYGESLFYLADVYLMNEAPQRSITVVNQISSCLYDYYLDYAISLEDSIKDDDDHLEEIIEEEDYSCYEDDFEETIDEEYTDEEVNSEQIKEEAIKVISDGLESVSKSLDSLIDVLEEISSNCTCDDEENSLNEENYEEDDYRSSSGWIHLKDLYSIFACLDYSFGEFLNGDLHINSKEIQNLIQYDIIQILSVIYLLSDLEGREIIIERCENFFGIKKIHIIIEKFIESIKIDSLFEELFQRLPYSVQIFKEIDEELKEYNIELSDMFPDCKANFWMLYTVNKGISEGNISSIMLKSIIAIILALVYKDNAIECDLRTYYFCAIVDSIGLLFSESGIEETGELSIELPGINEFFKTFEDADEDDEEEIEFIPDYAELSVGNEYGKKIFDYLINSYFNNQIIDYVNKNEYINKDINEIVDMSKAVSQKMEKFFIDR